MPNKIFKWLFTFIMNKQFVCLSKFYSFLVLCVNNVFSGWVYPWMDWTFPTATDDDKVVSDILNIYGFLLFCSPVIGAIPGAIFKIGENFTGSKLKGDIMGLIVLMKRVLIRQLIQKIRNRTRPFWTYMSLN